MTLLCMYLEQRDDTAVQYLVVGGPAGFVQRVQVRLVRCSSVLLLLLFLRRSRRSRRSRQVSQVFLLQSAPVSNARLYKVSYSLTSPVTEHHTTETRDATLTRAQKPT